MKNMSFALTTDQIRARTKTVTRRVNWRTLKPGTLLQPVVKCQGIRKGEKVQKIGGPIRVTSVRFEPLWHISPADVRLEGFDIPPAAFIEIFCVTHKGCTPKTVITRIEFSYVEERL